MPHRLELRPDSRQRRFEVALDVGRCTPSRTSASIAARKAASVLPDPVGAATRVCRPPRIAGQASICACVGAAKAERNQLATAG
jgi:hypothetical protein